MTPDVLRLARGVARDLMAHGALAVALTGSHVYGTAHDASDIDLVALVRRRPSEDDLRGWLRVYRLRGGRLVSLATATPRQVRALFRNPRRAPTDVPGWRDAVLLADPHGVGARLKRAAQRWTWADIAEAADRYVAAQITGWSEEVHKLAGLLPAGHSDAAAVQRSLLAMSMAHIVALRRRLLFGTENVLWSMVSEAMGEPWASTQRRALSMDGESLDESCGAALELYALAAAEVRPLLDRQQRAVVDAACRLRSARATSAKHRAPPAAARGSRGSR